eukprot:scaffold25829_cov117-Cylindrotheca_fusiformis.AAC.1
MKQPAEFAHVVLWCKRGICGSQTSPELAGGLTAAETLYNAKSRNRGVLKIRTQQRCASINILLIASHKIIAS